MIGRSAIGLLIAAIVIAVVVVVYWLALRRGRQLGTRGLVQRSRLTCPKCQETFDYDFVPGASFTAFRLGTARYMRCPLCHRWSTFEIYDTMIRRPS